MRKINEVVRLKFEAGLSHAKIARAVGLSKGAVAKYISLASAQGIGWPTGLSETQLEARLFPPAPALTPLPGQPYEYAEWRVAKPGIDYHLAIGHKLYSVPHTLVGHGKDWDAVHDREHPPGFRWLHESFGTNWRITSCLRL